LPEKHRIVLVLHYYDRMHYSQIANALDVSLSAVRVRIFRAKRFLRRKLGRTHHLDPRLVRLLPASPPSILPVCFTPRANQIPSRSYTTPLSAH
jgi:hypothetical protein